MQYTLESDFAKHVRGPELHRVYLLYGSQSLLIEQYEKKLIQKALDGGGNDFNLHRFTGEGLDLQAFYDAVESLPLMAPARCVTLDLTAEQLGAGELKELCAILAYLARQGGYRLPEGTERIAAPCFAALKKRQGDRFGNGREARRLFQAAVEEMALRSREGGADTLLHQDVTRAIRRLLSQPGTQASVRPIGF